jgi:alkylation response protein AidB-like acyl-CoA dehydrogenase
VVPDVLALDLTEEQSALADAVRRFLADRGLPRQGYAEPAADPADGWPELAGLGVVGALVAEQHGGLGLGMHDLLGVLVELGRACFRGPYVSTAVGTTTVLAGIGETDLLAKVASGDQITVLVDDPEVRVSTDDRLSGRAMLAPDAAAAGTLLVAVRDDAGARLYAVEASDPGVSVQPEPSIDASRSFASVALDDAGGSLLAGDAADALAAARDRMLAALAADGLGAASALFALAKEHTLTRVQFDVPVATFQAVQHALVDAYAALEAGKVGVVAALRTADSDDPVERHRAAVMAGAWCCDGFADVAASAIQLLGGIGFTWEHDAQLYYKRLMSLQTAYGGTAAHLAELAALTV